MLTPFRSRLVLPGVLLHTSAKWFGLLRLRHTFSKHLVRCLMWLLPQCLQHFNISFDSGTGWFIVLLRCFGGALDFFRMSNVLIFSTGVFALGDCPLIALRWAHVVSDDRQISKHFASVYFGSCNSFRRTLFSAIPQTRRSRIISSFKVPNSHVAVKARRAVA